MQKNKYDDFNLKKEIGEGMEEYEDLKNKNVEEKQFQLEKIIEELNNLNTYDKQIEIESLSVEDRNTLFKIWFNKNPDVCMRHIGLFDHLSASFQNEIVGYLNRSDDEYRSLAESIIHAFDLIENEDLNNTLKERLYLKDLVENRQKMQDVSEEDLLSKVAFKKHVGYLDYLVINTKDGGNGCGHGYNLALIAPYIDHFPSIDKKEAINKLIQSHNEAKLIIIHKDKLGLSSEEVVGLFYENGKEKVLLENLSDIDKKYRIEVIEKLIQDESSELVWDKLDKLDNVTDIFKIVEIIRDKEGLDFFKDKKIPERLVGYFINKLPKDVLGVMISDNPNFAQTASLSEISKEDREKILTDLVDRKDVVGIFNNRYSFELEGDKWAFFIIEKMGVQNLIDKIPNILKKKHPWGGPSISMTIYQELMDVNSEKMSEYIHYCDDATESDIYEALKNGASNTHYPLVRVLEHAFSNNLIKSEDVKLEEVLFNNYGPEMVQMKNNPNIKPFFENIANRIDVDNFKKYEDQILESLKYGELVLDREDFYSLEEKGLSVLSISDLNVLKRTNNLELSVDNNDDAKLIYQNLKEKAHDWKDTELNGQFEKGAEIFGYGKMFDFAKPGRRHDALYAFDRIIKLYETSGLTNRQFYNNILLQVSKDTGRMENDDSGGYTSHQRLNDITKSFREDIDNVIKEAKEFNTLKRLRGLAEGITGVKDIFQNFKMLSQYHELTKVLLEKEFIDALSKDQNQKRRDYVDTLFYHPTIENKQSVKDFWQNPEVFLSANASHASGKIHDNKKPSNYHQIPNLDLTPENMRDVLIEGGMDEIQAWEPLEIGYRVPKNVDKYQELESRDFQQMLLEALGKRGETKGKVKQPEKTAKLVVDILGIKLSDLKDVVSGDITPTDEQKKTIVDLVFFDKRGYNHKSEKYLAKINLKSDPDGLVAGNDTKTCDPFGDGKNVLYTYNPICASFTLQKEIQKGKFTTIGQSILTKDKDVGVNISKLKEKLEENGHIKFEEEVPESVLREAKSIIAADSIEVSDNYRTGKYSQIISDLYKDFFAEYINRYAERDNLDPSKVVTGSCSYGLANLSSDKNTFLPESPVSYSDKYKDDVHVIDFSKPRGKYFIKEVFIKEKPRKEEVSIDEKNVHYLTHQDTLPTAYLEGKIYSDTSMQQGLHEMENTLIAKDINNAHKDRPNMSLKYVNNEGKMQGYMVAFEGEIGVNRYEETKYDGEKCVYVMDIAKSSESVKGGVSLINGFIELYKKNYIDKNNTIPIFAEMREKTSFNLVMKKLDKLTAGTGKKFEVEELGTWNSEEAGDTRHVVIIRCVDA